MVQAKLVAIARREAAPPSDAAVSGPFPDGATLLDGDRAWVLLEQPTPRSAGPAVVWAMRHGARSLRLIVGAGDGTAPGHIDAVTLAAELARRLGYVRIDTSCAAIVGTDVVEVEPAPVPAADGPPGQIPGGSQHLADLLVDSGLEVVVEHGVVRGEVLGLEVARVETLDGVAVLGVGVGRFDREITAMLHAGLPDADALDRAASVVRQHRFRGGPPHPLQMMARARWVRAAVVADPSPIGCESLIAVDTTIEPESLRDLHPAAARGASPDGAPIVVVCTSGVDLDVVTLAADTRARHAPDAALLLVSPTGERFGPIDAVAAQLDGAVTWREVEAPWS